MSATIKTPQKENNITPAAISILYIENITFPEYL